MKTPGTGGSHRTAGGVSRRPGRPRSRARPPRRARRRQRPAAPGRGGRRRRCAGGEDAEPGEMVERLLDPLAVALDRLDPRLAVEPQRRPARHQPHDRAGGGGGGDVLDARDDPLRSRAAVQQHQLARGAGRVGCAAAARQPHARPAVGADRRRVDAAAQVDVGGVEHDAVGSSHERGEDGRRCRRSRRARRRRRRSRSSRSAARRRRGGASSRRPRRSACSGRGRPERPARRRAPASGSR